MLRILKSILLVVLLAVPGVTAADNLENIFNKLNEKQREHVQIRLREPGFYTERVDGRFGEQTARAIRSATYTPAYPTYRAQALSRGIRSEDEIALYYVMSNLYLNSVILH
ncbi:MAG: peptidoglycan-binding domain-containing protein [Tropicimonas sp.]|uniref:peptidoglycan-binding domain-containing protein n=1 Tax=Tropicimonas sp. TaxID=2067044 RepID=UPI003A84F5F5